MSEQTPTDVIDFIRAQEIRMVDLRFIDMLGSWQHFSVPAHELTEESFEEGFGFDGSSVRGWKTINASDMLVIPEARTAKGRRFPVAAFAEHVEADEIWVEAVELARVRYAPGKARRSRGSASGKAARSAAQMRAGGGPAHSALPTGPGA